MLTNAKPSTLLAEKLWKILRFFLLLGLSFVLLYPIIYMVSVSVREAADMTDPSVIWIPRHVTTANFRPLSKEWIIPNPFFTAC